MKRLIEALLVLLVLAGSLRLPAQNRYSSGELMQKSFSGTLGRTENERTFDLMVDGCWHLGIYYKFSDKVQLALIDPNGKILKTGTVYPDRFPEPVDFSAGVKAPAIGVWKFRISTPWPRENDLKYAFSALWTNPRIETLLLTPSEEVKVGETIQVHLMAVDTKNKNHPISGLNIEATYREPKAPFKSRGPALPLTFVELAPGSGDYVATLHADKKGAYGIRASVQGPIPDGAGTTFQRDCTGYFFAGKGMKTTQDQATLKQKAE